MKRKQAGFRFSLLAFFLMLSLGAAAPETKFALIIASQPIRPFEKLLWAVFLAESSGDTLAFNAVEEAVGGLQIRPIRLLDYNLRTGKNYKIGDCYNFRVSREIFLFYAGQSGTYDYESIARNWNGSGKATLTYWNRVKLLL